jgi:2-oxo-hept-3-ene-1,7-dioate hydratase
MLDKHTHTLIAHRLHQAEQSREQIRQISLDYPTITIDDAYAVQREWVSLKIAEGRVLKGHKIGLTSKAMQASSQISEPDYGALLDDMFFHDGSDIPSIALSSRASKWSWRSCWQTAARPELHDLRRLQRHGLRDPRAGADRRPLPQRRPGTQRPRKVFDTISDNAANAGVILGGRPIKPDELDLRWISALLYRNGVIEETGVAAGVLNHPANGVAWLATSWRRTTCSLSPGRLFSAARLPARCPPAEATPSTSTTATWAPSAAALCRRQPCKTHSKRR